MALPLTAGEISNGGFGEITSGSYIEIAGTEDTLIIVTADHDHAMAMNGYCGRGTPILGLCRAIDNSGEKHLEEAELAADDKPYTVLGYLNGPAAAVQEQTDGSFFGTRPVLTEEIVQDPDYIQESAIPQQWESHSPVDVAIYAAGPWAHLIDGTVEQHYVYHVMKQAFEAN